MNGIFLPLDRFSVCLFLTDLLKRFFSEESFHEGTQGENKGRVRAAFLALNFENLSAELLIQGKNRKPFQVFNLFLESVGPGATQNLDCLDWRKVTWYMYCMLGNVSAGA